MVQLALGFHFQNMFSGYEQSFGKLKYRTLIYAYIIISGVKKLLPFDTTYDTILNLCLDICMVTVFMSILL